MKAKTNDRDDDFVIYAIVVAVIAVLSFLLFFSDKAAAGTPALPKSPNGVAIQKMHTIVVIATRVHKAPH